jgi:hypothetical protein
LTARGVVVACNSGRKSFRDEKLNVKNCSRSQEVSSAQAACAYDARSFRCALCGRVACLGKAIEL